MPALPAQQAPIWIAPFDPHAQSTREKGFPQKSGPVTTRSRLGMLLQASGDRKRARMQPALPEMVTVIEL